MKRDVYKIKKLLAILISVILLVGVLPLGTITASAATSGTTGDCTWSLDGTVDVSDLVYLKKILLGVI